MIRYCRKCERTAEHTVRVAGGNAAVWNAARWLVCAKCGLETRMYDLRRRSWAGK